MGRYRGELLRVFQIGGGDGVNASIPIAGGQVSTVDNLSPAPISVVNWQVDAADVLRPRPSLVEYATTGLPATPIVGLYVWRDALIGVSAAHLIYVLYESSPTTWVAISGSALDGSLRPTFAEDGLSVVIAGGGEIERWDGGATTARLGGGPNASHIASLGQRFVANDINAPQEFDYSNPGDGAHSTWGALSFTTADARPDPVVAIWENLRELFVFGETTTQVYSVGIDAFNPFDFVSASNIGCLAPYSIVRMDTAFAFLDQRRRLILSDGRSDQELSEAIAKDLRELSVVEDCWGYREDLGTYSLIVWVFPTAGRTFVYDVAKKSWRERAYYSGGFQVGMPIGAYVYWPALNKHLVASTTTGALYELDPDTRTDLGGTLLSDLTTGEMDFGIRNRKRSEKIVLVCRRGTVPINEVDSQLEVRVRDDRGAWSDWEFTDLGEPSDADPTIVIRKAGVFRRRQYQFRYSGTHEISLVSAEQHFQELAS